MKWNTTNNGLNESNAEKILVRIKLESLLIKIAKNKKKETNFYQLEWNRSWNSTIPPKSVEIIHKIPPFLPLHEMYFLIP